MYNDPQFLEGRQPTVSRREVKTGKSVDSMIQITDNLMADEKVVYEGMLSLSEGAKVNDLSNPKPAAEAESKKEAE